MSLASLSKTVEEMLHELYRRVFKRNNSCFFLRLDPDILVNELFPYLLVEDLLSLRRANKALYLITHESVIWRRYLRRIEFTVCPVRPTFDPSDPTANYELETLVTSACALYRSWALGFPKIRSERILVALNKIVDLKLLPGGKFLVASVKDRRNFRFFIHVYAMDIVFGSRLLARLPVFYKVYDLQAKYMDHNGKPGIMISYTRRRFQNGAPANLREDINNLHHRTHFDSVHPLIYEACCIHMPLDPVETLIRPDANPSDRKGKYAETACNMNKPFVDVLRYETYAEIHSPTIFEDDGRPCIAFAENKDGQSFIQIITLDNRLGSTLYCEDYVGYEGMPHRIRAIRYLPCQKGMLVIRSISSVPETQEDITFEIFDCPRPRHPEMDEPQYIHIQAKPIDAWECEDGWKLQGEVVISDPMPSNIPDIRLQKQCPPTIWAFAPSEEPKGCAYWWFRAEPVDKYDLNAGWKYTQTDSKAHHHRNDKHRERALPGTERTLYLELDDTALSESSILTRIRRFYWAPDRFPKELQYPDTSEVSASAPVTEKPKEELVASITDPLQTAFMDVQETGKMRSVVNDLGGLTAITWDEYSGKMCLAAENEDKIRVYDMAPIAEPHLKMAYHWRLKFLLES